MLELLATGASTAGGWVLEKLTEQMVTAIPSLPPVRNFGARIHRGSRSFAVPTEARPTLILIPALPNNQGDASIAPFDQKAADGVSDLLQTLGFAKGKHWEIRASASPLSADDRRRDLVLICGSNPMLPDVLSRDVLRSVRYHHDEKRDNRYFEWRNYRFRWDDNKDFALVAAKPNPYNPKARLVLLFGLRAIGTLGAARLYAEKPYTAVRREIARAFGTQDGDVEVLLRVSHPPKRDGIDDIAIATLADGEPSSTPRLRPVDNDVASLHRIYTSLEEYPSATVTSDIVFETTILADYGIRFKHCETWAAGDADVVIRGRMYSSDVDLSDIRNLKLEVKVVNGGMDRGEVVALIATNELQRKRILFFPIPPIRKDEEPRRYERTAQWPNAARPLATLGKPDEHTIIVPEQASGNIDRFTGRFVFELPGQFKVRPLFFIKNKPGPTETFGQLRPFEFVLENVAPKTQLVIEITRVG